MNRGRGEGDPRPLEEAINTLAILEQLVDAAAPAISALGSWIHVVEED